MQEEISFGVWLRKQRRALDLSRQAFADQVGCAEVTLRRIEAGTLKPSHNLALVLLQKLGIPASERMSWVSFARGTSGIPLSYNSLSSKPITNLPAQLTTFVGRDKEQVDVISLISRHRLVMLTGSGGVGKTRLSIKVGEQIKEDFSDGVWLVELAPLLDPLLVPRTTALAIGLRDEPQRPVIDMLSDYLREKQLLIILDNCEHLVDACAQIADTLLKRCSRLKILATSRELLGILGEAVYRVPSLQLPDLQQTVEGSRLYESVRLFEERAQLVRRGFSLTIENAASVAEICSRLDGIPLAIELAAARVGSFSAEQIARRLQENFSLLTAGNRTALPRHQTLQAAIDWSYDLLSPAEQALFRRLSVFVNGWTLEAAKSVCSDANIKSDTISDLLHQLINKSLVITKEEHSKTRYRMLETIRQYANKKLVELAESEMLRDRHLEYFLILAEIAEPHLIRSEQTDWLPLLDTDYENLRLAFKWSLIKVSHFASLRLCAALGWYWEIRCYWLEGANWLRRALANPSQIEEKQAKIARVRSLNIDAQIQWHLANLEQMHRSAEASLQLALENSDEKDIAISKYFLAAALRQRGGEDDRMLSLLEQSFAAFKELNDLYWKARSFTNLVFFLQAQGKLMYRDAILQSLELTREAGDRVMLADLLYYYADWLFRIGEVDKAKEYAEESDRLYKQIGSEKMSLNPFLIADIAWCNGNYKQAKAIYMQLYERCSLLGDKGFKSNSVGNLGLITMEEGDLDQAKVYLEEALLIEQEAGWKPWVAYYLVELGNLSYLHGKIEQCKHNFKESLSLRNYFTTAHKSYILMTMLGSFYIQKPDSSARLLGVIHNSEREIDFPRTSIEKRYCSRAETHVRKALGDAAFATAFASGQKMSLDEALDLALRTVEEM